MIVSLYLYWRSYWNHDHLHGVFFVKYHHQHHCQYHFYFHRHCHHHCRHRVTAIVWQPDYDQIYFALQDIFPNKTHLPSFNSAAIESHLFRIPNLSSRFLYMCDDFMFGSNVTMDDFYTKKDGYKVIIIKGEVTYLNEIYIGGKMASTKYMLTVILLSRDIYWW